MKKSSKTSKTAEMLPEVTSSDLILSSSDEMYLPGVRVMMMVMMMVRAGVTVRLRLRISVRIRIRVSGRQGQRQCSGSASCGVDLPQPVVK